ncbi:MAG TPA: hypothetical protein VM734_17675 [Kofleriaceae bacterium]|jgi:hypothetical protein|nr:hypothetical protein [Kofleriaceae bacterium]
MTTASKNEIDLATEFGQRIDHVLRSRRAPAGTRRAKVEDRVKHQGSRLWSFMKRRPLTGVALVSGGSFLLATALGVGELTLSLIVGYAAYEVLREGVPPMQAAREVMGMASKAP